MLLSTGRVLLLDGVQRKKTCLPEDHRLAKWSLRLIFLLSEKIQ